MAKDLIKRPVKWFTLETIGNFLYDQLGALWRSAVMTALLALALRFYSSIPLDIRLIIGLFLLALAFLGLERFISRQRNKQSAPVADEPSTSQKTTEDLNAKHERIVEELKDRIEELERKKALTDNFVTERMDKFLLVESCAINSSHLSKGDRYIDFAFSILNLSIYAVSIPMSVGDLVNGPILFKGKMLSGAAKLAAHQEKPINPADRVNFTVRQWVNKDEAEDIVETLKKSGNLFDFSQTNIFVVNNGLPDAEPMRLDLTRGMQNASLENEIIQLKALQAQLKPEISEIVRRADVIYRLSIVHGMVLQADDTIRDFATPLPKEALTYLNANIDSTLYQCFGAQGRDEYYEHMRPVPDSADEQRVWVYSHRTQLGAYIEHQQKQLDALKSSLIPKK